MSELREFLQTALDSYKRRDDNGALIHDSANDYLQGISDCADLALTLLDAERKSHALVSLEQLNSLIKTVYMEDHRYLECRVCYGRQPQFHYPGTPPPNELHNADCWLGTAIKEAKGDQAIPR